MDENKKEEQTKDEKKDEAAEMKDRLLRLAAEFDNYKKRTKSDVENAKQMGKAEFIRDMLPVLDEFELAMIAVEKSQDRNTLKGIELLYSNFVSLLKKQGLKEIDAKGRADPYKHEVVLVVEDSAKKPGTIIEVTKKGYMLNDIILRHSSVIVTKEPEIKQENIDTKNENKK